MTSPDPDERDSRRIRFGIGLALLILFAARLGLAARFYGYLTGDDLEIVETAAKYAFGLPYTPWNIRCLFYPLVFVFPLFELASAAGIRGAGAFNLLAAVPPALASTAAAWMVFRIARLWRWPTATALAAFALYAAHWLALGYGSTPYPRPVSAALFLAAFFLIEKNTGARAAAAAGLLCAAAFAVRTSDGIAIPVLALWIASSRRRIAPVLLFLAGVCAGALLFAGLPDLLTWGRPFASLHALIDYHRDALQPAFHDWRRPWYFYAESILRWVGPGALVLALAGARDHRIRKPLAIAAAIVALLSVPHVRDWRFLQTAIPFVALAAAIGWQRFRNFRWPGSRAAAWVLLVFSVGWGFERTFTLLRDKSQAEVDAARCIAREHPEAAHILLEQAWAYGDRLYFTRNVEVFDLVPARPLDAVALAETIDRLHPAVLALYVKDTDDAVRYSLAAEGYREEARFSRDSGLTCAIWSRRIPRP
jgi:Alg9-like mannosyltransferase family